MTQRIGFVGAGQLGEPMVRRLLGAGYEVTVYARRDDVRQRLLAAGARLADSVAEVATGGQVIISCLFSDDQLREVVPGADGLLAHADSGAILVSHTTGTVDTVHELAGTRADVIVLDAPVSGTADDIVNGRLTVLLGGESGAAAKADPILRAYADTIIHTGALGSALNIKLVNNVLFAANAQLLGAAADVATQVGVDPDRFLDALAACSADSKVAGHARGIGGMAAFTEAAAPFLRKDVNAALLAARDAGADLGLLHDVIEQGPLPLTAVRQPE